MRSIVTGIALAAALAVPIAAAAECQKDRAGQVICGAGPCARDTQGQVFCAPARFGSVVRTTRGETVCARGQCVITLDGDVVCSAVDGGGAVKQSDGSTRCEGHCERATAEMCERNPAGR